MTSPSSSPVWPGPGPMCGHGLRRPALPRPPQVRIGGWVRQPLDLDAEDLDALGAEDVPGFVVRCTLDGAHGGPRPMRGVLLRRLIERAEPDFGERTDFKRTAVVAEGADGYRALFSWGELFHTPVGGGVYLAFDCARAPLDANTAPFALLSLHDTHTGPRFVRRLVSVDLRRLW